MRMAKDEGPIDFEEARRRKAEAEQRARGSGDPDAAAPAPLRWVDPISWQGQKPPAREWLVRDWVPWGHVTGLYGDGGTGKSLLTQQLATCVAVGHRWLGLDTRAARVLVVPCEDEVDELWRRQEHICDYYKVHFGDLENLRFLDRFAEDNILMDFEREATRGRLTAFFAQLADHAVEFGAQLVVVDTVADTFGGGENNRPQVRQYIAACLGGLARRIGGSVVACAHPSLAGIASGEGTGGSTAWNNTMRGRLYFSRAEGTATEAPDPDKRLLSRKKSNYARIGDEVELRWKEGVFDVEYRMTGGVAAIERRNVERLFVEALGALEKAGRVVSDKTRASNYAPKVALTLDMVRSHRPRVHIQDFELAMSDLLTDGRIKLVPYGQASKGYQQLIVSAAEKDLFGGHLP